MGVLLLALACLQPDPFPAHYPSTAAQVRCKAYASLAAFPMGTLEGIDALRPLSSYAALLRQELQLQPLAGSGAQARGLRRAAAQALAECEALVRSALAHEHATRRRVAAGGGGTAGRERGGAAAAMGPGAATVSHRLQSVLPKQLVGGSAATAADLLARLPEVPVVAVLYLYAPQPPPASGSKAAAAAAARQAAASYQSVFVDLLRQHPPAAAAAEDAAAAAEVLAAWAAFLRRWLAALRAASKPQATDAPQAAAGEAAMQVWAAVQQQLEKSSAIPTVTASCIWSAAALCGCTPQPLPPLITAVHSTLCGIARGGPQHSAAAQRAALAALGSMAEAVRVTLGVPVLQQTVQLMQQQLEEAQQQAAGESTAASVVTGLGLACAALAGSVGLGVGPAAATSLPAAAEQQLRASLASLLGLLLAALPSAADSGIAAAAAVAGLTLQPSSTSKGLLPSAAAAVATALPAAAAAFPLSGLLRALHHQLYSRLASEPQGSPAEAAALCALSHAVAAAGFRADAVSGADVSATLASLVSVASSSGQTPPPDGRVVGAAAAAAGALLAEALQQGVSPAQDLAALAVLQLLLSVPEAVGRLPQAAAAKLGAAVGISALLAAAVVDPALPQFKAAGAPACCATPPVGFAVAPCSSMRPPDAPPPQSRLPQCLPWRSWRCTMATHGPAAHVQPPWPPSATV